MLIPGNLQGCGPHRAPLKAKGEAERLESQHPKVREGKKTARTLDRHTFLDVITLKTAATGDQVRKHGGCGRNWDLGECGATGPCDLTAPFRHVPSKDGERLCIAGQDDRWGGESGGRMDWTVPS